MYDLLMIVGAVWLVVTLLLAILVVRLFTELQSAQKKAKQDASKAVSTSKSVIRGQVAEQLFPLSIDNPFDPGDMKFLGQPVDYVVFSGANTDVDVSVYFLEVKTGKSQLSPKQRAIKDAVEHGRVFWETVRIKGAVND